MKSILKGGSIQKTRRDEKMVGQKEKRKIGGREERKGVLRGVISRISETV